ncbi:methyltransferase domain-containing protein [Candidatus Woesearchaeota archaeon]|nr:methyltransferase domain-containing protein [Candidatus Woesearchaeota archaeon]
MNAQTVALFDRYAEQYSEITFSNILQYELNRFISFLPRNAKILDIGCGSGRDVQYFMDYGFQAVGIDASEKMIEEAKRRVTDGGFKIMKMQSLDFPKESFDAAWILDAISFIDKKDILKFLPSLYNVLKNDAVIFISARQGVGETEVEYEKLGNNKIKIAFFYQEEIEELLSKNGFEIINIFTQDGEDFTWINAYARKK